MMNERIRELADKSGFGPAWYDPTIPTSDIDRRWIDQRRLKEFAELIVRECMACSTWVGKMNTNSVEPVHTAHAINQRIKKHFGVQE